jgi:hypothetical protein
MVEHAVGILIVVALIEALCIGLIVKGNLGHWVHGPGRNGDRRGGFN